MKNYSPCILVLIAMGITPPAFAAEKVQPVRMGCGLMTFDTTADDPEVEFRCIDIDGNTQQSFLLKRSQLISQEMLQLENHLRNTKATQRSLTDEKSRMETQIQIFREQERAGNIDPAELEGMLLQFEAAYEQVTRQLRDVDAEAAEIEGRLMRKREDLEAWQDLLDRRLGGF